MKKVLIVIAMLCSCSLWASNPEINLSGDSARDFYKALAVRPSMVNDTPNRIQYWVKRLINKNIKCIEKFYFVEGRREYSCYIAAHLDYDTIGVLFQKMNVADERTLGAMGIGTTFKHVGGVTISRLHTYRDDETIEYSIYKEGPLISQGSSVSKTVITGLQAKKIFDVLEGESLIYSGKYFKIAGTLVCYKDFSTEKHKCALSGTKK